MQMLCGVCGHDQFEQSPDSDLVKCESCGKEIMKDDLVYENQERINAEIQETAKVVVEDAKKELKKTIENAFKGVKGFKIK